MPKDLFVFDPRRGLEDWLAEGDGAASVTPEGRIRLESFPTGLPNPAVTLWCRRDFPPDVRVSFDFMAHDVEGRNILFLAAAGVGGEDILTWTRPATWDCYAHQGKMRAYSISFSRDVSGQSGLRKLWAPRGPVARKEDRCPLVSLRDCSCGEAGVTYHFEAVKEGARIRFWADGRLIHDYLDDGQIGPPLGGGKIGLRNFAHPKRAEFWNIRVAEP